jgi:hypothetical protein
MRRAAKTKVPEEQVVIRDFGGFVTSEDPHDLPPGTAIRQVNAQSIRPGELRAARGTGRPIRLISTARDGPGPLRREVRRKRSTISYPIFSISETRTLSSTWPSAHCTAR